ncbi:hypothetical protein A8C32_05555 [Flavivirga aquatica]|uniref:DUF1254 domain-containing protein n=1 Tax=Flavivirga aquatica TaxID=1849968 RepID=A0A1E5SHR5_9FLAO|nr:DUF1254 domain-containing protein [Flavivirga aquatica]OEJ98665.1 hypothetical protein A8C32_05555 [Flavivirga aquatica]
MNENNLDDVMDVNVAQKQPIFKADVPKNILTPDIVETERLGTLNFFDGMPLPDTIEKVYDNLDYLRGVETFLNGIPAASVYAVLEGIKSEGVNPEDLAIFEELMDARSLFLTANSTTIYCIAELNVKDAPIVIETPANILGPIDDAYFRYVTDLVPEKTTVFKHIDDETHIPDTYDMRTTRTYRNLMFFRVTVPDGKTRPETVQDIKDNFKMYPYLNIRFYS